MIIAVFRFELVSGGIKWTGNLTHPYPIRYAYTTQEINSLLED
jgi:hypothetical protein